MRKLELKYLQSNNNRYYYDDSDDISWSLKEFLKRCSLLQSLTLNQLRNVKEAIPQLQKLQHLEELKLEMSTNEFEDEVRLLV